MEVNEERNQMKSGNKYFFPIASWILFLLICFVRFSGLDSAVQWIKGNYLEMSQYQVQLNVAQLVFFISIYLMLSTIVQFIRNEKIRIFYYLSSIMAIMISVFLIEDFYHYNAVFMNYKGFIIHHYFLLSFQSLFLLRY